LSDITLVTGAAGFIGYHVANALIARGERVLGVDNLNAYYDPSLKEARLAKLTGLPGFQFERMDISERNALPRLFADGDIRRVVHLAAQAGVRYSLIDPHAYIDSNITGFLNVLEQARHHLVEHFVYASSSSVYGANKTIPFSTRDRVDHPISLYAATKRANELMAYTYAHQFAIPLTGLRFFTVYGPWGRPDMAAYKFARAICANEPVEVYNFGDMRRDFTYIDDIVNGVLRVLDCPPSTQSGEVPHKVYNLGNGNPQALQEFIRTIAAALGREPRLTLLPMQPGDVPDTFADVEALDRDFGWRPSTAISTGIPKFVEWYLDYHGPMTPQSDR
jgi:UDP-glucuronate 4-epimerase